MDGGDEWMGGMHGWMDEMNGCMDGWMSVSIHFSKK